MEVSLTSRMDTRWQRPDLSAGKCKSVNMFNVSMNKDIIHSVNDRIDTRW